MLIPLKDELGRHLQCRTCGTCIPTKRALYTWEKHVFTLVCCVQCGETGPATVVEVVPVDRTTPKSTELGTMPLALPED